MSFQGAKWLKIQALLDEQELANLFDLFGQMKIFPLGIPLQKEAFPYNPKQYLEQYGSWIEALKQGEVPTAPSLKTLNMTLWCENEQGIFVQELPNGLSLIRPSAPQLQVQVHWMGYSSVDQVFRPMVLGQETIFWGLQWSYPQVGQNSATGEILELKPHPWFVALRKWCRDHTFPTPMQVGDTRINLPMRIGKQCFSWIQHHPQLAKVGAVCAL